MSQHRHTSLWNTLPWRRRYQLTHPSVSLGQQIQLALRVDPQTKVNPVATGAIGIRKARHIDQILLAAGSQYTNAGAICNGREYNIDLYMKS